MNRISLRTVYVGTEPTLYGKTGWAHRPANSADATWTFHADEGGRVTCTEQDVRVWLGGAANAA
jgi:hypothetical protein